MIEWDLVLILGVVYVGVFWGLPMCALPSDSVARLRWPNISEGDLIPYWKAVRQVSLVFHIAAVISWGWIYFWLIPFLTVTT